MAQSFPETAHLKTDRKAYAEGWDRIFGKPTQESQEDRQLSLEQQPCVLEEDSLSVKFVSNAVSGLLGK